MLACFPPIILAAIFFGKKMRGVSRQAQDQLAESNTVVEETLQGVANVKAFTNEPYEIRRYTASIELFLSARSCAGCVIGRRSSPSSSAPSSGAS